MSILFFYFSDIFAFSIASFSSLDNAYVDVPLIIGLAYILDESDAYIPFNTMPLFFESNKAKAKLKSLPTSAKAEYLTIPTFCIHSFKFEFKLFANS